MLRLCLWIAIELTFGILYSFILNWKINRVYPWLKCSVSEGRLKYPENDKFFAFLDINPLAKGHTLVIPKQEVDYIFDLSDEDLAAMHVFAKKVALAIGKAFPCKKVGEAVLGLEVPHAHIHLIPMQNEKDMLFSNPKLKLTDEEFKAVAESIRMAL